MYFFIITYIGTILYNKSIFNYIIILHYAIYLYDHVLHLVKLAIFYVQNNLLQTEVEPNQYFILSILLSV